LKNTLRPNTKKSQKSSTIPALFRWKWVGLLKNTLDQTQRKESQRAAHHSIPAFIGGNWVGLLKNTLKTKHKERNHKEQHITQSLLLGRIG
jgi:truncated hemoglobin YjbI